MSGPTKTWKGAAGTTYTLNDMRAPGSCALHSPDFEEVEDAQGRRLVEICSWCCEAEVYQEAAQHFERCSKEVA